MFIYLCSECFSIFLSLLFFIPLYGPLFFLFWHFSSVSLYEDILSKLVSVSPAQRTAELRKFQEELDGVTTAARALELYGETECGLVFLSPFEKRSGPIPEESEVSDKDTSG